MRAVACDLSETAVRLLKASLAGTPHAHRVRARAWDITRGPPPELLPPPAAEEGGSARAVETADLALLVFTLSAVGWWVGWFMWVARVGDGECWVGGWVRCGRGE